MKRPVREMPLYPSETEIATELLGAGRSDEWRGLATVLERQGLPRPDPAFGARYWPAVRAWLDRRNQIDTITGQSTKEEFTYERRHPRRAGAEMAKT